MLHILLVPTLLPTQLTEAQTPIPRLLDDFRLATADARVRRDDALAGRRERDRCRAGRTRAVGAVDVLGSRSFISEVGAAGVLVTASKSRRRYVLELGKERQVEEKLTKRRPGP